jgi:uncharacterized protein YceK
MKMNERKTIMVIALLTVMLLVTLTGCSDLMKKKKSTENPAVVTVGQPVEEQSQGSVITVTASGEISLPPMK